MYQSRKICGALLEIQKRGIRPGDLKSENIVISEDGKISIIDFGYASRHVCDFQFDRGEEGWGIGSWEPEPADIECGEIYESGRKLGIWIPREYSTHIPESPVDGYHLSQATYGPILRLQIPTTYLHSREEVIAYLNRHNEEQALELSEKTTRKIDRVVKAFQMEYTSQLDNIRLWDEYDETSPLFGKGQPMRPSYLDGNTAEPVTI